MVDEEAKRKMLYDFNNTDAEYPKDKTIHQLFEEQVARTPNQTALVFEGKKLTYRELNEKANSLAGLLREKGVRPDHIVGIMFKRSLEMIIAVFGILKAGGAYLPIDPGYPEERINYMIEESKIGILLTHRNLEKEITFKGESIIIDETEMKFSENLVNVNKPTDLIYIIYTSGSTGKPKGVMLTHDSVNNLIHGLTGIIDFSENKTFIWVDSISFDISVFETLVPLAKGLKLVIANEAEQKEPKLLKEAMMKNEVRMISSTPSRYKLILDAKNSSGCFKNMTEIFVGGEALPKALLERLTEETGAKIYNMYGPTETTVWSTVKEITDPESITIGRPINNTRIYILDSDLELVELGAVGELYIGGSGLARGYLHKPEMTNERFIPNPFNSTEMIYRTGDLARWLPDGEIEYIGRVDHQVKIRGFRIELEEIEVVLRKNNAIKDAIVLANQDSKGNKYLCAYLVSEREVSLTTLRDHLSKELPDYMIPSYFIKVEKIPLTPNGKVDREALAKTDVNDSAKKIRSTSDHLPPTNEIEQKVIKIFMDVFELDEISMNDDFIQLGGDSLKAIALSAELQKEFNVSISMIDILTQKSIKDLANTLRVSAAPEDYLPIEPAGKMDFYPVSSEQEGLISINNFDLPLVFNVPMCIDLSGDVNIERLRNSFGELFKRHESFRTSFHTIDGKIVQKVDNEFELHIDIEKSEEDKIQRVINEFIQPFDIMKGPLHRIKIVEITKSDYKILFDMHHIIGDGMSLNMIFNDLANIYFGKKLPELSITYKDYAIWQKKFRASGKYKKLEIYWKDNFLKKKTAPCNFPYDNRKLLHIKPPGNELINFEISKELKEKMEILAQDHHTTLSTLIFTIYSVLINKYTGRKDFFIGNHLSGTIRFDGVGSFGNFLPIRVKADTKKSFLELLTSNNDTLLEVYQNQDYDLSGSPLLMIFKLMFSGIYSLVPSNVDYNFLNYEKTVESNGTAFSMEPIFIKGGAAFHDFQLNVNVKKDILDCWLEYNPLLFKEESVKDISKRFNDLMILITNNPHELLDNISIFTEEEQYQILKKRKRSKPTINFFKNIDTIAKLFKKP